MKKSEGNQQELHLKVVSVIANLKRVVHNDKKGSM